MDNKEVQQKKFEAQLDKLDNQLIEMKAKAAKASATVQEKYYSQIEDLGQQRDLVSQQFEAFTTSSEEAWEEIKLGLDNALTNLKRSFKRASAHFE